MADRLGGVVLLRFAPELVRLDDGDGAGAVDVRVEDDPRARDLYSVELFGGLLRVGRRRRNPAPLPSRRDKCPISAKGRAALHEIRSAEGREALPPGCLSECR
jgi:hypothetical protein